MKSVFFATFFGLVIISTVSAQNNSAAPKFLVGAVVPPTQEVGNSNCLLALSDQDFKNKKYVFYTDSNATVAYVNINGTNLRLTGGPNPENIMVYTCKGYTLTLKKSGSQGNSSNTATMVIYDKMGQAVINKVTGTGIK